MRRRSAQAEPMSGTPAECTAAMRSRSFSRGDPARSGTVGGAEMGSSPTIASSTAVLSGRPAEGISKMETIFQAHPGVKVVCSIGGGGSIGANEAAKAGGKITEDFGIFAADATQPELTAMKNDEGVRMTATITGTNQDIANEVSDMVAKLKSGEAVETKEIFREVIPVTKENLDTYLN